MYLNEVLRATLKPLEAEFSSIGRPPVTVELFLDESMARVSADSELLRHGLESLFLRARDAMPAGGTLTIRTRQAGGWGRIEISQSGALDANECARMFTGYHAASAHATGLGLATVQLAVSEMGGRVSAETTPGMGTAFVIELPTGAEAAAKSEATAAKAAPANIARVTAQKPKPAPRPPELEKPREERPDTSPFPLTYR
jgi:signal transduction histidine kinase